MTTAYYVHGIIAPCLPVALSPETKQTIRGWIGKMDDLMDSSTYNAAVLIPGCEEYASRSCSSSDKSL